MYVIITKNDALHVMASLVISAIINGTRMKDILEQKAIR